ncbi:MAG TPA: transketolase [Firmicutes bacterium]|jgi:transketolase|nr:transketolase [Bacillota bacterium]
MLEKIADVVRGLVADSVQKAKSGHPGMPLGAAEIGAVLYSEVLAHDPTAPDWPNRDRFVLSAGHGSMLLYSFLHLTGYDMPMSELQQFRQLGSRAAGHPEYGMAPGIETTTGPLGQGIANAVGMALAEAMQASRFNKPGYDIVNHYTYTLVGDGDLMEGVASEAASLAGHLGLGKLIAIYDANSISIEGSTDLAFTEDVAGRFSAYGWHVQQIDGHDCEQIATAIAAAQAEEGRPSLIIARTSIGKKSLKENSNKSHGEPLGEKEVAALKKALGFPDTEFYVPAEVYEFYAQKRKTWAAKRAAWEEMFERWSKEYPELRETWDLGQNGVLPDQLAGTLSATDSAAPMATRDASGMALQQLARLVPYLVGGSADLAPSTKTYLEGAGSVQKGNYSGRNLHFGVREHAMGSILNGMSLYGGLRVFGSTFLVFVDYMRPALRMAAMMKQPVIYVFTHDSIYVGEDGPTHQPIEQLESIRIIPGMVVIRPADAEETRMAWAVAMERKDGPTALILTRQKLPVITTGKAAGVAKGAYVLRECSGSPALTLIATGSEVALAMAAAETLAQEGKQIRIVSMPSRELFCMQDESYKASVLLESGRRLIIEAGVTSGWSMFTRPGDKVYGINRFGESGPAEEVAKHLNLTSEAVTECARQMLD